MLLRQLEFLTALARERHFARAAEACHPSPSEGIPAFRRGGNPILGPEPRSGGVRCA
ncbi:LysR family transcriptional regulator, partial [Streptomyces wuyuanensis]